VHQPVLPSYALNQSSTIAALQLAGNNGISDIRQLEMFRGLDEPPNQLLSSAAAVPQTSAKDKDKDKENKDNSHDSNANAPLLPDLAANLVNIKSFLPFRLDLSLNKPFELLTVSRYNPLYMVGQISQRNKERERERDKLRQQRRRAERERENTERRRQQQRLQHLQSGDHNNENLIEVLNNIYGYDHRRRSAAAAAATVENTGASAGAGSNTAASSANVSMVVTDMNFLRQQLSNRMTAETRRNLIERRSSREYSNRSRDYRRRRASTQQQRRQRLEASGLFQLNDDADNVAEE
jgi:hypothetical protein